MSGILRGDKNEVAVTNGLMMHAKPAITCSKLTIETRGQVVKYVQR